MSIQTNDIALTIFLITWLVVVLLFSAKEIFGFDKYNEEEFDDEQGNTTE